VAVNPCPKNGYRFDIQRLAALVQPGTRLISLTTPHNPTGTVLATTELHAAIALAERHDCYVLVDERSENAPCWLLSSSVRPKPCC
jgi:aspartate/methionine/tyrosine aminotransferase